MTAALLDRSLPSRRPVRQPASRRPSHLRVLDQSADRRRARLRAALGVLFFAVLAGFFGVAFVHAQLVAGQQHLDDVRTQIRDLEAGRAELIQSVEQASAPHVIVNRAKNELGMVSPETPVYLAAVPSPEVVVSGASSVPLLHESVPETPPNLVASPGELVKVQVAVGQAGGVSGRAVSDLTGVAVAVGQTPGEYLSGADLPVEQTLEPSELPSLAGLQVDAAPELLGAGGGQG